MVEEIAQLYTIEGIIAAITMILTALIVLGSVSLYTPGDAHISDMQLHQLGADAMQILDTGRALQGSSDPDYYIAKNSPLENYIFSNNTEGFYIEFNKLLNEKSEPKDRVKFETKVFFRSPDGIDVCDFNKSMEPTGKENGIIVSRFLILNKSPDEGCLSKIENRYQAVLIESYLWRD